MPPERTALLWHEVGELYAAVDSDAPEHRMMAALARAVPCYSAVLNAVSLRPNHMESWSSLRREGRVATDAPITAHLHRHPTLERLTGEPAHCSLRLSDVAGETALRSNPFIAGYYRPNGLSAQITFSIGRAETVREGAVWVVGLNRTDQPEFSAADLACSEALRPHLHRAMDLLRERRLREAALAVRDGAAELADCGTAAIDSGGRIVDATPAARRLLRCWYGVAEDAARVPRDLLVRMAGGHAAIGGCRWFLEGAEGTQLSVHCRWDPVGGLAGLWLREVRPADVAAIGRGLGLTPRQASIARCVADGKTNAEIGLVLGISARTVEKHLEQMLARLGVENRAAVMRAVRDLQAA